MEDILVIDFIETTSHKWRGIFQYFKQHPINIKNYTAHLHDMVHLPAQFWENTTMCFWVTVRKLNVTDRQMDGGAFQYLPSV